MVSAALTGLLLSASVYCAQAVEIYLYPPTRTSVNSFQDAAAALSRHIGLEMFEPTPADSSVFLENNFVGVGIKDGLVLAIEETDARVVLPTDFKTMSSNVHIAADLDSGSSIISTYLHRAPRVYSSIFSPDRAWQLTDVDALSQFFDETESPAFAALEISKLRELRERYGSSSEEYESFATELRQFLDEVLDKRPNLNLGIVTYSASLNARQVPGQDPQQPLPNHPAPQQPIGSISTCFTSLETCNNRTSSCSGRGNCVEASKAGRTCFVCACGVTKTGEGSKIKTERWAGESCERKDVSGPFVLLTGTVIVLLIVIVGSISLLYSIGDQALPSILLAGAVNGKKD